MPSEVVHLTADDGVKIVGDYYPCQSSFGVILLHMMPKDRKSWTLVARRLQGQGFHALAIDLRGHGESEGGPDGYMSFSDNQHQAAILDVERAALFLKEKGVATLHLIGASIGANLALQYLSRHPDAVSALLLSPGLNYRGIATEQCVAQIRPHQGIYIAASQDDHVPGRESAVQTAETLFNQCQCRKELKKFTDAGHGTTILERYPEFVDELVAWLLAQ